MAKKRLFRGPKTKCSRALDLKHCKPSMVTEVLIAPSAFREGHWKVPLGTLIHCIIPWCAVQSLPKLLYKQPSLDESTARKITSSVPGIKSPELSVTYHPSSSLSPPDPLHTPVLRHDGLSPLVCLVLRSLPCKP